MNVPGSCAALLLIALTVPGGALGASTDSNDPLQGLNRKTHAFNEGLDNYLLRPVARGWSYVTPDLIQDSLKNFDDNIRFPVIAVNDILQWKWRAAAEQTGRFAINTTVGIFGFCDVAAGWGLAKQNEDTGQTFGKWGIPPGPYLVLPLFGPSNPRDAIGLLGDAMLSIYWIAAPLYVTLPYRTVDLVNRRALADEDIESARKAALDFYVFVRNAYRQRRNALIHDIGETNGSETKTDDDLYDLDDLYELDNEK